MYTSFALPKPISNPQRRWPDQKLVSAPRWCAVDLRDGNQALPKPLTSAQKFEYFKLLTDIGFKEIEIGFPAASRDDWTFCRTLIEDNLIPDDVTISVLTQARPHIIAKTLEALSGVRHAVCHLYIAASDLFLKYVFKRSRNEVIKRITESVRAIRQTAGPNIGLEFSPEEFTDSDLDFISQLCNTVVETWFETPPKRNTQDTDTEKDITEVSPDPVILNLPSTVERALPMHYADMIETFIRNNPYPDKTVISLHAHNDMGAAVADTELALLAGGQRVEGTLFGNGERSGNVDIVTLALNLHYLGIDTGLDFSKLEALADKVAELTNIPIPVRQPYAGELTFTTFAGSHQDAINKGFTQIDQITSRFHGWKVPYFHIDPSIIGRSYQEFIRITSQSGKGGIDHVLQSTYGVSLPKPLLIELAQVVQQKTDLEEREYSPQEIWNFFLEEYVRLDNPLRLINFWPRPDTNDPTCIHAEVHIVFQGKIHILNATGNGPVAAFAAAIRQLSIPQFILVAYEERAIGTSVNAQSITIITLKRPDDTIVYGVGFGSNIIQGAAQAIISAINRL